MAYNYSEEIRYRVDLQAVAERYGMEFNRAGYAHCPFHKEKTASFKIQNRQFGHCFGCNKNADAVTLTMEKLGLDYIGAVRRLNRDFNLGLPVDGKPNLRAQNEARRRADARRAEEKLRECFDHQETLDWDIWCLYDVWRREYAPKNPNDAIDPRYAVAVREIDNIAYRIDTVREEWDKFAEQRKAPGAI